MISLFLHSVSENLEVYFFEDVLYCSDCGVLLGNLKGS